MPPTIPVTEAALMGHIRLGPIPKSRPWSMVVASVVGGTESIDGGDSSAAAVRSKASNVATIAARTLDAAEAGLARATDDAGLRYTVYLLTQVALASRSENWAPQLAALGIVISSESTLFDLTSAFQAAIDDKLIATGSSSDFSELAQKAAGEALWAVASDRSSTLFGNSGDALQHAVRSLSTPSGFGSLGQAFFGRFLTHYLNFYISRITAAEIGNGAVRSLGSISQLNEVLALHCEQSAAIVRDFAGEWYSKTEYQRGIDQANVGGFVAIAVKKLAAELRAQKAVAW